MASAYFGTWPNKLSGALIEAAKQPECAVSSKAFRRRHPLPPDMRAIRPPDEPETRDMQPASRLSMSRHRSGGLTY